MRVGTRIKELCAAPEGMGSATAAEIHQAVFPMRFTIAEGWQRVKAPKPAKQPRPVYVRPSNPLFPAWSAST